MVGPADATDMLDRLVKYLRATLLRHDCLLLRACTTTLN
jgi:hypothetical protein